MSDEESLRVIRDYTAEMHRKRELAYYRVKAVAGLIDLSLCMLAVVVACIILALVCI